MTDNEVPDSSHSADLTGHISRGLRVTNRTSEIVGFFPKHLASIQNSSLTVVGITL